MIKLGLNMTKHKEDRLKITNTDERSQRKYK